MEDQIESRPNTGGTMGIWASAWFGFFSWGILTILCFYKGYDQYMVAACSGLFGLSIGRLLYQADQ